MAQLELHHDEISQALAGHRGHHEAALTKLQAPTDTDGVPGEHLAAVTALLGRGQAIHQAGMSHGVAGENANRDLQGTDEGNASKFKGAGG